MVVTLPAAIDIDHFEIDPAEGCGDTWTAARRERADRDVATSIGGIWTVAATPTFGDSSRHRRNAVSPTAGALGRAAVRVTILTHAGRRVVHGHDRVRRLHEPGGGDADADADRDADGHARPRPRRRRRPPRPPRPRRPRRRATPTADTDRRAHGASRPRRRPRPPCRRRPRCPRPPRRRRSPPRRPDTRPVFQLSASGKRSVRVKVRCPRGLRGDGRADRRREHRPQAAHGELAFGRLAAAQPQARLRDAHRHARRHVPAAASRAM